MTGRTELGRRGGRRGQELQAKRRNRRRMRVERPEGLEPRLLMAADPIINEISSANQTQWLDDQGNPSDFIEIYNPSNETISLANWSLTDLASDPLKWQFPAVEIPAGEYLLVAASGDDRRNPSKLLHTNFRLAEEGEYLALVRPDGTVAQQFNPLLPQPEDMSYGSGQRIDTLVQGGMSHRYYVPTAADAAINSTWMQRNFNAANWVTGEVGVGYGLFKPGYRVRLVDVTGGTDGLISSSVEAQRAIDGSLPADRYLLAVDVQSVLPVIDVGSGSGTFGENQRLAAETDEENIIIEARTTVTIPEGNWTIGFGSDDGGYLRLDGVTLSNETNTDSDTPGDDTLRFNHLRGHDWTTAQLTVGPGGLTTQLTLLGFSQTDEFSLELAIRAGHSVDPVSTANWQLLRNGTLGWQLVASVDDDVQTNVQAAMQGINASLWGRAEFTIPAGTQYDDLSLRMRYDDGVVVYLNGQEIVRRLAPDNLAWNSSATAKRSINEAFNFELINLDDYRHLLVAGTNVLAYRLLNASAADATAVFIPELRGVINTSVMGYFAEPTPGTPNGQAFVDVLITPQFSVDRGFFTEPFSLVLTTPTSGATIRYTLNGEAPTATNGFVYSGPIMIDKTSMVRAATFKTGNAPSLSTTHTYLFLQDVIKQSPQGQVPSGWPGGSPNGQRMDYGMDPDIVNSPTWSPQLIPALTQIPSFSITTNISNLLSTSTGIYVNAGQHGKAWERPASIELIDPANEAEFQINAGLRIRGGFSRAPNNPKHSFRLLFRKEYGDGKLDFPLFEDEGVDEFDNVDLRTTQNYSWSFGSGGDTRNSFVRDIFSREVQGLLGAPYTKGRFYHLYLNGQYWGLYQTDERAEASFAASYLGGEPEDYDVVKNGGNGTEATDGDLQAYRRLWLATNAGYTTNEAYYRVQGMNTDGTRNPAYERLVDVDNLINYMIITYFTGDMDGPGSRFTQPRPNNFVGIYNRNNPDGFKWIEHDSEHSLDTGAGDMVNPLTLNHSGFNSSNFNYFNPHWLHERMVANAEYRQRFADRVQETMYGRGPLAVANAQAHIQRLAAEINMAIVAESARWGDAQSSAPRTKTNWETAIRNITNWFTNRHNTVLNQFKGRGWFPATDGATILVNDLPASDTPMEKTDKVSFAGAGTLSVVQLNAPNRPWFYLDNGTEPAPDWNATGFVPTGWKTGDAELGYGDGDETTTVGYGPDANSKYITTYFRRSFTVSNAAQYSSLLVRVKRDDGVVVYINGQEAMRDNMPAGPVTSTTLALGAVGGTDESTFFEFPVSSSMLVNGTNTIAVELHQSSGASSDLSFDLELLGLRPSTGVDSVYYTLDGTDPRSIGGAINPSAIAYDGTPFSVDRSRQVKARVFKNNVWSVLTTSQLVIDPPPTAGDLVLSEIYYHPTPPDTSIGEPNVDDEEFEYVELLNASDQPIDLTGAEFTVGIDFEFPFKTLAPGQRGVLVKNLAAFTKRFPNVESESILGTYTGSLSNSGEQLVLVNASGDTVFDVTYDDAGSWSNRADGSGSSLELVSPTGNPNESASWKASVEYHGTPGRARVEFAPTILINEVLTNTTLPDVDAVELVNVSNQPVNLSGWYLSDSADRIKKYKFPATTIPAGGYLTLTEAQFNSGGGTGINDFALSSAGDDVWLVSADASGRLTRFIDRAEFDGSLPGVALGRLPNAHPDGNFFPLAQPSLGTLNGPHRSGELVVSEVHYNPTGVDDGIEFVELVNTTGASLNASGWRVRGGVSYDVPAGTTIPANGVVVLVSFNPSNAAARNAFLAAYPSAATATLWGPWSVDSALDNGGERVSVLQPDVPAPGATDIPYVLIDEVRYDDEGSWPTSADGNGSSLNRRSVALFGNSASSWSAATPTPGTYVLAITGDVNGDSAVNAIDLNLIAAQIRSNLFDPRFDFVANGKIDAADMDYVVENVLQTTRGDFDLDRDVDSADLLAFLEGWTGAQDPNQGTSSWEKGDADGDGDTDSADLLILLEHWTGAGAARVDSSLAAAIDALFERK